MNLISPESQKLFNLYEQMLIQHQHQQQQQQQQRDIANNQTSSAHYQHQGQLSLQIKGAPTSSHPISGSSSSSASSNSSLCSSKSQQSSPTNSSQSPPLSGQQGLDTGGGTGGGGDSGGGSSGRSLNIFSAENSYRAYVAAALAASAAFPAAAVAAAYQNQLSAAYQPQQSLIANHAEYDANNTGYSYPNRLFAKPGQNQQNAQTPTSPPHQNHHQIPSSTFKVQKYIFSLYHLFIVY